MSLLVALFRLIPFKYLYAVSDGTAFLLYRIIGYRKKVIRDNLRRAFPEKDDAWIAKTARSAYQNLADITLEALKSFSTDPEEIHRRCHVRNPELVQSFLRQGRSVILAGSHYNNWEYPGLTLPLSLQAPFAGVYKPLSNASADKMVNRARSRAGTMLVPMEETFKQMRARKDRPTAYMFISDQSPSSRKNAIWVDFFGIETAFLPGVDVLARKFNLPVVYFHVRRVRRGYYELEFELLADTPSALGEGELAQRYASALESEIRAEPGPWLWSHKRWKMAR